MRKQLTTQFAPETRFEVTPTAAAPFRAILETHFERLQNRLLQELLSQTADAELNLLYRHAAAEAAAIAATTGFPVLVLPILMEEKAQAARSYTKRQQRILKRSSELTGEAA